MTEANRMALTGTTSRRWASLFSVLKAYAAALDYDPQILASASTNGLVNRVSRLETKLAVLEQQAETARCRGNCH